MQNEPNFKIGKMTLTSCCQKYYGHISPLRPRKNKPNQTQFTKRSTLHAVRSTLCETNPIKPNESSAAISERPRPVEAKTIHITVKYEFVMGEIMMNSIDISANEEKKAYQGVLLRFSDNILGAHIFGRILYLLQTIVGYTFMVCLGLGAGRLLGGYIGSIHAENIRHTINFLDFSQLRQWQDIPRTFAKTGAAAGVIICLAAARIVEAIYLDRTIISLCKEKPSKPADIANILGTSVRQIRRRMNRLAGKGLAAYPITESLEGNSSGGKRIIS